MAYPPPYNPYGHPNCNPYGNMYPNLDPNANAYMYANPYPPPPLLPVPAVRRYQIRQKIFSFGDKFTITDEIGQPVLIVRGKVFSLARKLALEDMSGR